MPSSPNWENTLPDRATLSSERDDAHLVQASQQGDQHAFSLLVQCYQRRIFNLCWHMLQDADQADEATQNVFVAAWQGLPQMESERRFSIWLTRLTAQECMRQLQRRERVPAQPTPLQEQQSQEEMNRGKQGEPVSWQKDVQNIVRAQLNNLPRRDRLILLLHYLERRTDEEIAAILLLPIDTVKDMLFRARTRLKERMLAQYPFTQRSSLHSPRQEQMPEGVQNGCPTDFCMEGI